MEKGVVSRGLGEGSATKHVSILRREAYLEVYVGSHSKNIDDGPIKMAPYEKKKRKKVLTLTTPITNY